MAKKRNRQSKTERHQTSSKKKGKSWIKWIIALALIAAVGSALGNNDDTEQQSSENTTTTEATTVNETTVEETLSSDATPQEVVEYYATSVFGDSLKNATYNPDTKYIEIDSEVKIGGVNLSSSRRGFELWAIDFMEKIKDLNFDYLVISGYTDMVDQYGNSENKKVLSYPISKETVSRINYDNFNLDNFEEITEGSFIHPEFR